LIPDNFYLILLIEFWHCFGDASVITPNELPYADGFLFGFPTRFGCMAAEFKAFFDTTGGLWRSQSLSGKPAGFFYSTASQGGGQETTP